jgi:hypothetical protein
MHDWTYFFSGGKGYWNIIGGTHLAYSYSTGQWYYTLALWTLGTASQSAAFLGDGSLHDLHNGWEFALQSGLGMFYRNETGTPLRFSYNSNPTGMWSAYDGSTSANVLIDSFSGLSWMTDGQIHSSPTNLPFSYNYGSDELIFYANIPISGTPLPFLKYSWATSRWYDEQAGTGFWFLLPAGPAPQIGDYMPPLGPGYSSAAERVVLWYTFPADPQEHVSTCDIYGAWHETWMYHYTTGQWDYRDPATGIWYANADSGGPDKHR